VKDAEAHASIYLHVGREIANHRANAGLSQAELAAAIGLTRTSISNIEKGRQKMLVHTLIDIADRLRISTAALLPKSGSLLLEHSFSGSPVTVPERAEISALVAQRMRTPLEESVE